MNEEKLLELQAWVDQELSETDARRVEAWLQSNPEGQALVNELKMTKAFLADNEPVIALPESREFYWNKIAREIERTEKTAPTAQAWSWIQSWRRLLAPVSGLALVALLSVFSLNFYHRSARQDALQHLVEVENLSEHVGSISYRSQAENMFVVYLYDKDQEIEDDEFDLMDEPVLQ